MKPETINVSGFCIESFGEPLAGSTGIGVRLGYIDKETDKESDLGDYGFRKFDKKGGRFTSIDPLWEAYASQSPYSYCRNNPLILKDPMGEGWDDFVEGAKDIFYGARDAILSDASGQAIHTPNRGQLYDAAVTGGHVANLVISGAKFVEGAIGTIEGGILAPETGGASLLISGAGVAQMGASAWVINNAWNNMKSEGTGGGKNAAHANQKAKEAAQKKYDEAKTDYEKLKSKANKTKEDKKELEKLERQVKHLKGKADWSGESHSQKAKGSN